MKLIAQKHFIILTVKNFVRILKVELQFATLSEACRTQRLPDSDHSLGTSGET